jgi:hypothetical protein
MQRQGRRTRISNKEEWDLENQLSFETKMEKDAKRMIRGRREGDSLKYLNLNIL